jgi:hypothetical protein
MAENFKLFSKGRIPVIAEDILHYPEPLPEPVEIGIYNPPRERINHR